MESRNQDAGIDYSLGQSNFDVSTGIHYGVMNANQLADWTHSEYEPDYGPVCCPDCGNELSEDNIEASYCPHCEQTVEVEDFYDGAEPIGHVYENEEYSSHIDSMNDVWVLKSPYYTKCAFCSPCAPGAGYLTDTRENGIKTYCLGHDFFESGIAPYPVFRVSDDSVVLPEKE